MVLFRLIVLFVDGLLVLVSEFGVLCCCLVCVVWVGSYSWLLCVALLVVLA